MKLPHPHRSEKYGDEALETYGRRIARESMPPGSKKIKYSKSMIWRVKGRSSNTIILDLEGPCRGPLQEVMELGLKEAAAAVAASKEKLIPCGVSNTNNRAILIIEPMLEERQYHRKAAGQILKRLNELPREYAIRQLLVQLKSARNVQHQSIWKERILDAKERELHVLKQLLAYNAGKENHIIDTITKRAIA